MIVVADRITQECLVISFARWYIEKHQLPLDDPNTKVLAREFAQEMVDVLKMTLDITYVELLCSEPEWNFEGGVEEAIGQVRDDELRAAEAERKKHLD